MYERDPRGPGSAPPTPSNSGIERPTGPAADALPAPTTPIAPLAAPLAAMPATLQLAGPTDCLTH